MSKIEITATDDGFIVRDPNRSGRSWEVSVIAGPDDTFICTSAGTQATVFSKVEGQPEVLYHLLRLESGDGNARQVTALSDLPERYQIAEDFGARIDTYGSRYPGEVSENMADLLTWYVPANKQKILALIHVLEVAWTAFKVKASQNRVSDVTKAESDEIVLDGMAFHQQGKTLLMFSADVKPLLKFIEVVPNSDEHPDFPQRKVDHKRLKRIGEYVVSGGLLLPTIIINFYDSVVIEVGSRNRVKIRIPNDGQKHAYCLDGQHRLFTFDPESNATILQFDQADYELPVTAMVDEQRAVWHDQFVVINTEQRPVNKNQILAMQEHFQSSGIDEETSVAVRLVEALNVRKSSALYKRVFIRNGDQSTLVKLRSLSKLISGHLGPNGTFRTMNGEQLPETLLIELFESYLNAIVKIYPEEWESTKHVLTKTAGWETLFSVNGILPVAYRKANRHIGPKDPLGDWFKVLEPMRDLDVRLEGKIEPLDWTSYKFRPYCSGRINVDKFVRAVKSAYEDIG